MNMFKVVCNFYKK